MIGLRAGSEVPVAPKVPCPHPPASPASVFGDVSLSGRCPSTLGPPKLTQAGTHVSCAGAQPPGYSGPTVRAGTPGERRGGASGKGEGLTMRVQQDHPTSPSNAKKKKVLFCGICFHTPPGAQPPKMPGPQLTSLSRSLARSPRAPRPPAPPPGPAPS